MKKDSNKRSEIWQPTLLALMVAVGMFVGYKLDSFNRDPLMRIFPGETNIKIGKVEEVLRFLESKYLYDTDADKMTDEAIQQIISNMDPYTMYVPEHGLHALTDQMNGEYKGIGIETMFIKDTIMVSKVLAGSPAEKAGIRKMDRLVKVEEKDYTGEKLDFQAFREQFMKAEKDSVQVSVVRKGNDPFDIWVVPGKVENTSVRFHYSFNDSTLYVKLNQFVSTTYRDFMKILEEYAKEEEKINLIIDVRDNPGGYLGEVTKILSQFFEDADLLLVKTKVRNGKEMAYKTTGRNFYQVGQIFVLINGQSASGSEVLAGCIQDLDRGLIIGSQSYGKGLVQEQYNLTDGGALRLTVANYYLPSGRSIQNAFQLDTSLIKQTASTRDTSQVYKSLIKGRDLLGSSGVIPDIETLDSSYQAKVWPYFFREAALDEKVVDYIESNSEELPQDFATFYTEFKLKEEDVQSFKWWKNEDGYHALSDADLALLVKARMANLLFSEGKALKILQKLDPAVIAVQENIR